MIPVIRSQECYPTTVELRVQLIEENWVLVVVVGLEWVHEWPQLRVHNSMMISLLEKWHNETLTFHLLNREVIISLLYV